MLIGMMIGVGAGYFWAKSQRPDVGSQPGLSDANREIYSIAKQRAQFEPDAKVRNAHRSDAVENQKRLIGKEINSSLDNNPIEYNRLQELERKRRYASAMEALHQGDLEQAKRLLNELMLETEDEQLREQIKQGLMDYYGKSAERLRGISGQADMVLFKLFEKYKLSPDSGVKNDIVNLSREVYEDARQYLREDDLLTSADYYFSLSILSKVMDFEVFTATGDALQSHDFSAELQKIRSNPEYLQLLEERAEERLYYGSEPDAAVDAENFLVFWDYANLAMLSGEDRLQDAEFREDFIQASLYHLNQLKEMDDKFELKSRIEYIRWAFPSIMTDERISNFN